MRPMTDEEHEEFRAMLREENQEIRELLADELDKDVEEYATKTRRRP